MEWASSTEGEQGRATACTSGSGDTDLKFLLPIYQLLRNECADAAYLILIKEFRNCSYMDGVSENENHLPLYDFLKRVDNSRKRENQGKLKDGGSSQQEKRSVHIHNLDENKDILSQVTVQNLRDQNDSQCRVLKDLDLSLLLNIIANRQLDYRIDKAVLDALNKIKETRNKVFHPRYRFPAGTFDEYITTLATSCETLYKQVDASQIPNLRNQVKRYKEQGLECNSGLSIIKKLQEEIYKKYMYFPEPTFVHPVILDTTKSKVIEDLPRYITDECKDCKNLPMLLCGSAGTGKSTVFRSIAASAVKSNKFSLVLYLEDIDRKPKQKILPVVTSSTDFWDQVYHCVESLAASTVGDYGLETVKAVIGEHISNILFIVDWNMMSLGNIFKEMHRGTWIAAHREVLSHTNDWMLLEMQPFSHHHVLQLLQKHSGGRRDSISYLYEKCEYKYLITSPDMVQVFLTHGSAVNFGTDFELIAAFVDTTFKNSGWVWNDTKSGVLKLGEVALNALKMGNSNAYSEKELNQIGDEVKDMFLCHENRKTKFRHSSVQDFIAALYVFHNPAKACREWLSSAPSFMRVFKFVCGMWCHSGFWGEYRSPSDRVLTFMECYLTNLLDIKSLKKCKENREVEPMEVEGSKSKMCSNEKGKKKKFGNPLRNAVSNWDYIIALDDVCQEPKVISLFAKLLSSTPCWIINTGRFDDRKLIRLAVLLKKVKLDRDQPVTIKLESTVDVRMLIKIWNKLKNIESLQNCAKVKFCIARDSYFPITHQDSLRDLCRTIVNARCRIFITSYTGPLLCSTTLEFLKGSSLTTLDTIDVIVYDVSSLVEILKCDHLPDLKYISVTVELTTEEQLLTSVKPFSVPDHRSLKLRIKYFDNIQKFLDMVRFPGHIRSLSIYDIYITLNFSLNLVAFEDMENLSLRVELPDLDQSRAQNRFTDEHFHQNSGHEDMEIDRSIPAGQNYKIPRRGWMLPITVNVKQPPKLERLLLRNMDFYDDSNNNMLLNLLERYRIQKLIILDSQLSLKGVRKVLSSHTSDGDDISFVTKKLKNNQLEVGGDKELLKRPRLSVDEREQKKIDKPKGKEIVITSEMGICAYCRLFPCICAGDELDRKEDLDDLADLLKDVYLYDIVSFNYSSRVATVRKDVCGDLRVHCALPGLKDETLRNLSSDQSVFNRFFKTLALAQSISLEQTHLSFQGVKDIVDYLKQVKQLCLDRFSLTIVSSYHTLDEESIHAFIETIRRESMFSTFNFTCSCENKCFKIKKTYNGKMLFNDRLQEG